MSLGRRVCVCLCVSTAVIGWSRHTKQNKVSIVRTLEKAQGHSLDRRVMGNLLQPMTFERLDQVGCGLEYQKNARSHACSLSLSSLSWMLDSVPVHVRAEHFDL